MLKSSIDDGKKVYTVSEGSRKKSINDNVQKRKQEKKVNTKNVVQSLKMYFLFSNESKPMREKDEKKSIREIRFYLEVKIETAQHSFYVSHIYIL